jgi:hypothetical protein
MQAERCAVKVEQHPLRTRIGAQMLFFHRLRNCASVHGDGPGLVKSVPGERKCTGLPSRGHGHAGQNRPRRARRRCERRRPLPQRRQFRTIAVGNDARELHPVHLSRPPVGVRRIHSASVQTHSDLTRPGLLHRQLAVQQHFPRRSLPVVPDCLHDPHLRFCTGKRPCSHGRLSANPVLTRVSPVHMPMPTVRRARVARERVDCTTCRLRSANRKHLGSFRSSPRPPSPGCRCSTSGSWSFQHVSACQD